MGEKDLNSDFNKKGKVLSEKIFSFLPFKPEAICTWTDKTDLLSFLYELHDSNFVSINESGDKTYGNYRDYGKFIFDRDVKYFNIVANEFNNNNHNKGELELNLNESSDFGLMAKYTSAWKAIVAQILSESSFVSISHVLESESEIDCSINLASSHFYKQATQVLRNFLEELILPLYFIDNLGDYIDWKNNDYFTPKMRGKNGLINKLKNGGTLSLNQACEINDLYNNMNGFIHGSENRLNNKGIYNNSWKYPQFDFENFKDWVKYFCKSIESGINLMYITNNKWKEKTENIVDPFCLICHNKDNFDLHTVIFGNTKSTKYSCGVCGNIFTKSAE